MYISGINGYLSKFEGTEVDAAVERVQGLDAELALKVDKTTTINNIPLTNNIVLTAEDIGAVPAGAGYGKSLKWEDSILSLLDQEGRVLSNTYIEVDLGRWGHIFGDLNDQADLKLVLDSKQPLITPENMLSSDLVDDTGHIHKFATSEQLAQIETNKNNIATNAANIDTNAANIAINTADIAINKNNIATNTTDITTNRNNIATNTANIATNTADIATNRSNIATNTSDIATNTSNIVNINSKIPSQATSENQLADKAFVNSSISTNTATFVGTFNSLEELEAYSGPKDDNDYAFVVSVDSAGNTLYNRYKYNGTQWLFEYALNNSSFTAAQWASIMSGVTSADVAQITTNKENIATNTADITTNTANIATNTANIATNTANIAAISGTIGDFGNIVTHNVSEFATAAQGAKADTALQSIDSTMVTEALGYTPYDASNPEGYISSASISTLTDVSLSSVTNNQALLYNASTQKWENRDIVTSTNWGTIGGTLANQTDLKEALDSKYDATNPAGYISGIDSEDVTTALGYTPLRYAVVITDYTL